MPTNEERREIAASLRSVTEEERKLCFTEEILAGCIGTRQCLNEYDGTLDEWLILQRLADLIEPEPERTCKNVAANADDFCCSECTAFARGAMIDDFDCWYPIGKVLVHCPNCGARVKR